MEFLVSFWDNSSKEMSLSLRMMTWRLKRASLCENENMGWGHDVFLVSMKEKCFKTDQAG